MYLALTADAYILTIINRSHTEATLFNFGALTKNMRTLAAKIIAFNKQLHYAGPLPPGIRIMNPFRENPQALELSSVFYKKFYNDAHPRHLILGINPGRLGAGFTGIPFTDTRRLQSECGIAYNGRETHEPSSVFIYEMIMAFGGPAAFYAEFYINSVCPLGFTKVAAGGKETNYNYYDNPALQAAVHDFAVANVAAQIGLGMKTDKCFCLGTGKNAQFLMRLNDEHQFFGEIVPLEHPRFIMQYRTKRMQEYIDKYLAAFNICDIY